jgi:hypothetical protein
MYKGNTGPGPHEYEIIVAGHLDERWSRRFAGFTLRHLPHDQTLIAGPVIDQPALHGVLASIRDAGLTLISVARQVKAI